METQQRPKLHLRSLQAKLWAMSLSGSIRWNSWHCAVPTLDLYEQLDVTTFNTDRISGCKQLFHETWPSKFFSSTCQWRLTNTRPRSHVNVARSHGWYSAQWRACQQRRGRTRQVINKMLIDSYSGPCAFSSSCGSTPTCTWSLCPRPLSKVHRAACLFQRTLDIHLRYSGLENRCSWSSLDRQRTKLGEGKSTAQ